MASSGKPTYATTPPVRAVDLASPRHVHLIGIGGAGMSAIALVLASLGHHVQGSDQNESAALDRLRAAGITVWVGHSAGHLSSSSSSQGSVEVVSRSTAIPDSNPEVVQARALGIEVLRRDELLAAITGLRSSIAVAGTHGKTTTSSMLTVVLRAAGLAPSFIIGGKVHGLGTGAALDKGKHLVVEADESDGTFLRLQSAAAIVTSVEPDHLDYYGSRETFESAFVEFLEAVHGPRIVSVDDPAARRVAARLPVTTYGTDESAQWLISDYLADRNGARFTVTNQESTDQAAPISLSLQVPGIHNARNASAALLLAMSLGVAPADAADALANFGGVARRYETRGHANGVTFVDDYAHLPSEVELTLEAARAGDWNRIICIFQPHRYTRTGELGAEFFDSFVDATSVYVTGIYSAGEKPVEGVTGELVSNAIISAHPDADVHYYEDRNALTEHLLVELAPGDLCLTLGAGDLTTLPDELMSRMETP